MDRGVWTCDGGRDRPVWVASSELISVKQALVGEGRGVEMGILGLPCLNGRGETVEVQVGGCHFHFKPLDTQQGERSGAAAAS